MAGKRQEKKIIPIIPLFDPNFRNSQSKSVVTNHTAGANKDVTPPPPQSSNQLVQQSTSSVNIQEFSDSESDSDYSDFPILLFFKNILVKINSMYPCMQRKFLNLKKSIYRATYDS